MEKNVEIKSKLEAHCVTLYVTANDVMTVTLISNIYNCMITALQRVSICSEEMLWLIVMKGIVS